MQKKNIEVLFVNNLNVVNKDTFVDKKETNTKTDTGYKMQDA